jgi:hypothetical protein
VHLWDDTAKARNGRDVYNQRTPRANAKVTEARAGDFACQDLADVDDGET